MNILPSDRARNFADEMDVIEDAIASENLKKSALLDAMRAALKQSGFVGPEIPLELAKLRGAIARRRMERVDPAKAAKAAEKAEGTEIYFDAITEVPHVRTREAA